MKHSEQNLLGRPKLGDGGGTTNSQLGNGRSREEVPSTHLWVVTCGEGNQRVEENDTWKLMEGGVN